MEQIKIVFVDLEEEYLMTLIIKFISSLKDSIDITVITDNNYLHAYLEEPHKIDVLVINEKLYTQAFDRYNIDYVFYLSDIADETSTEPTHSNIIYKYSSVNEIYSRVLSLSRLMPNVKSGSSKPKTIMVYSPIGGSGKTYTAIGIAKALSLLNKKVLYMNLETVQNFHYYLIDQSCVQNRFDYNLSTQNERLIDSLVETVRTEGFDYLPPFEQSTAVLNITLDSYLYLLNQIKNLNLYEYIIMDTSSEFNADKAKLMGESDKVLVVTNLNPMSQWKMECFLRNIDYSDQNRFLFVCNANDMNVGSADQPLRYKIIEYIKRIPNNAEGISTTNIADNSGFQKLAYYLL